jgi:hypothetical protein
MVTGTGVLENGPKDQETVKKGFAGWNHSCGSCMFLEIVQP